MGYFKDLATRRMEAEAVCATALHRARIKVLNACVIGSAYITDCGTSDIDVLVLTTADIATVFHALDEGWDAGGSVPDEENNWGSWKVNLDGIGGVNLLVTDDEQYYDEWVKAAEVCRYLHLVGVVISKAQRVAIHRITRDDSDAEAEVQSHLPALFRDL